MMNPFKPKTTRSIVIGKRPIQTDGAETPEGEQQTGAFVTIGAKTIEIPTIPKWVLPVIIGVLVIILVLVLVLMRTPDPDPDPIDETTTPQISISQGMHIASVDADAALADHAAAGDIVRIYGADGTPVQELRYVQVYGTADGALLILLDEQQTGALVAQENLTKVVLVTHNEPERSAQLLDLQSRINDPEITVKLQDAISLAPGTTVDLEYSASINPDEALLPNCEWVSSDPAIASVEGGTVKANEIGEAIITMACGGVEAQCRVTVIDLQLSEAEITLGIEETAPITATAGDFTVSWSSEDAAIATVDDEGTVTGVAPGTTMITATCRDVSVSCSVTVGYRAEVAQLDSQVLTIKEGETAVLTPSVYPGSNVIDVGSFTSSDTKVLTVAEDGTITAVAEGTATVTYKIGEAQATCAVTVKEK